MRDVVAKFSRYLLTGGAAAVVDVGGFALLHFAGVASLPAAAASFAVAAVVNYLLSSRFVFGHRGLGWRFPLFLLGAVVGLFVNVGVTVGVIAWLGLAPVVAKVVGIGTAFTFNFLLNLLVVFRPSPSARPTMRAKNIEL